MVLVFHEFDCVGVGGQTGKGSRGRSNANMTNEEGHQEETLGALIGWVMHGTPENGNIIIYCYVTKHTWLTVMSPHNVLCHTPFR